MEFLRDRGVKQVLVTNNSQESTDAVPARHRLAFDLVCARDDGPLKPNPEAFLGPLARLGCLLNKPWWWGIRTPTSRLPTGPGSLT